MKKTIVSLLALGAMAWSANAATKPKHITSKKRQHHTITPSRKAPKTKAQKGRKTKQRRSYQQSPTPERYKEIQQALASKGYFRGEPNGAWGLDSQEALKRFQSDQNLTPDGKIGSLSLIALGLGPKRLTAQSHAQPPAEPPKTEISK